MVCPRGVRWNLDHLAAVIEPGSAGTPRPGESRAAAGWRQRNNAAPDPSCTRTGSFRAGVLKELPRYIAAVHRLAKEFGARSVRTHDAFQEQLRYRAPDAFCNEPVHPNASGHLVIAHRLLQALGW